MFSRGYKWFILCAWVRWWGKPTFFPKDMHTTDHMYYGTHKSTLIRALSMAVPVIHSCTSSYTTRYIIYIYGVMESKSCSLLTITTTNKQLSLLWSLTVNKNGASSQHIVCLSIHFCKNRNHRLCSYVLGT